MITALVAIGGSIRFSDPQTAVSPSTRVAVGVLAGALWPVMAVGALLLVAAVPLLESLGHAPAGAAKNNANPRTDELALTGS
ncbi:MAG: hypothetical protein K0U76_01050 [Actinomycetia bacterium]|nr:hypothetical protein [Actinomycetes bacterium]MCH9699970.1 hypothetical protein [Actinomycetes bacterium]MCH9762047.1 hypothetical protein [Actinomycetes bacterium]